MAGIYVHIPYCTQRCTYCDFYFVTTKQSRARFIQALCHEIAHYALDYGQREPIETLYFGGGTPSLLTHEELFTLLDTLHQQFDLSMLGEVTLELNPEDADLDYLRGLRDLGINRLSIGIQSFFEADLRFMNRSHTAEQAADVVPLARRAGFDNFSIDLIFGLPDQPEEYWQANLEKALTLEVPHVSTYNLTVEPNTVLAKQVERGLLTPASEETAMERFRFTMDYLRAHGYEHYEISSFARPGFRARHNQCYWTHANYLGFGPSAHAFWWQELPAWRWANVRNLRRYEDLLAQHTLALDFREALPLDRLANEYLMLRLRTADGLSLDHLEQRYGVDLLHDKLDELAWLESEGYIEPLRNSRLRLTDRGKLVCDSITEKLMPDVGEAR